MFRSSCQPLRIACLLLIGLVSGCGGGNDVATPLPTALAVEAPTQLETGAATAFATSSPLQGPDLQWLWDFGNGQTSTQPAPQHAYTSPGLYTVTLTLRNGAGDQVQTTRTLRVGAFKRLEGRDCSGGAGTGWCWMVPSAAARAVHDIHFADRLHGVAVGELGHVALTQDGGTSWQVQAPAASEKLGLVRMADVQQVWAVATVSRSLLRSRDSGRTWEVASTIPLNTVREMWVTSAGVVVISGVGSPGFSLATWISSDSGSTWRRTACAVSELSRDGTLWSGNGRWVSHDLGLSCQSVGPNGTQAVLGANLVDDAAVRIVTASWLADGVTAVYQLWTSSDGGRSFVVTPALFPDLLGGSAPLDLRLGAEGRGIGRITPTGSGLPGAVEPSSVLVTADGGLTWRLSPDQRDIRAVDTRAQASPYVDDRALWYRVADINSQRQRQGKAVVVGAGDPAPMTLQIPGEPDSPFDLRRTVGDVLLAGFGEVGVLRWYSSNNNGRSWVALPGGVGVEPNVATGGIWSFDLLQGLWLRQDGVLLATSDGGRSWQQRAVVGSGFAYNLGFLPDGNGWAVSLGTLYRSADRGHQWQAVVGPVGSITQARFVDARTAWVAADQCVESGSSVWCTGSLHRTRDGGQSWTALPSAEISGYTPVAFADTQQGAWVDWDGSIRHTRDGGDSWAVAQVDVPLNQRAAALHFDKQGRGWLLPSRDRSRLLRSIDGGASWHSVALPAVAGLPAFSSYSSIAFGNSSNGWLVGSGGVVLASIDGGNTWHQQVLGTERATYHVFAIDGSTAWIAGSFPATLLTTSTGGD